MSRESNNFLDSYQNIRDQFDEALFFAVYENPWMKMLYPRSIAEKETKRRTKKDEKGT